MTIDEIREFYPYLKTGKIYFNHASTGPLSTPVLNKIKERLVISSEGEIDDFLKYLAVAKETKELLAGVLNCTTSEIAFNDNTTNGINVFAQGLKWNKGDHVLLNDLEFPANVYPFMNLQEQGVEVEFVKSHNGIVSAEDIIDKVKPNTKVISSSHVQFLTGYRIDLKKLGEFCKANNILFCVDAIQGLGPFTFDVEDCNIDFVACGTQKWLMGLQGMAFIYVSKRIIDKITPKYAGWLAVDDAWNLLDYNLQYRSDADKFQTGTLNTIGVYAFNASLKLFNSFGFDNISKRVLENTKYFISKLRENNFDLVLPELNENYLSGIVSFKDKNADEVMKKLNENNISCAVREGIVRFSPHYYNTKNEIDKVIDVLSSNRI